MDIFGRISLIFLMVIGGVICEKCLKGHPMDKYKTTNMSLTEVSAVIVVIAVIL